MLEIEKIHKSKKGGMITAFCFLHELLRAVDTLVLGRMIMRQACDASTHI